MKIPWNNYFITLAYLVSQRSMDPRTKHGCVITDDENTVLSMGYNNPPRGCNDEQMPLHADPDTVNKYHVFCHAEQSAIANAARNGVPLKNSTFYITGRPCHVCLQSVINVGAKKIIHGPVNTVSIDADKKYSEAVRLMLQDRKDFSIEVLTNKQDFIDILTTTATYIFNKN